MNMITVNINGMEYNLKGEENEEYLHKVARQVDKRLKHILNSNSKLSASSAAVLTAINAIDDMFKIDEAYSKLEGDMEQLSQLQKKQEDELKKLIEKVKDLEEYSSQLESKLKNAANEEFLEEKQEIIEKLSNQLKITEENGKAYLKERNELKSENKELKFELQTYKYKNMELSNKLLEKGIELTKIKKNKNPLIVSDNK